VEPHPPKVYTTNVSPSGTDCEPLAQNPPDTILHPSTGWHFRTQYRVIWKWW